MKQLSFTVQDPLGLHARPAGLLVRLCGGFESNITLEKDDKTADGKRVFAVMGLAVKHGDTLTLHIEGEDETVAAAALQEFFDSKW